MTDQVERPAKDRVVSASNSLNILFVLLLVLAFVVPGVLSLGAPVVALATNVRNSRWRMTILWVVGAAVTLLTIASLLPFGFSFSEVSRPIPVG